VRVEQLYLDICRLQNGMSGVLMAPQGLDSSGISSSAAVGTACLLALEHVNGLTLSISENVELDR
jgi:galacturonokinase